MGIRERSIAGVYGYQGRVNFPYLSFCVHSRNDNHGGDMYRRMQACLFGFFEQAERHKLNSEIVLVDWNPPKSKPLLKDAYPWPKTSRYCTIRIIVVPQEIHRRYKDWDKMPMNNTVGRNVALRHAKGKFVLATCIDNLLSDALVRFLALGELKESCLYLVNRCNVQRGVTRLHSVDEQLAYCEKNILAIDAYQPLESLPGFNGMPNLWRGGPGDFALMTRECWHGIRGCPETDVFGPATDGVSCYMACLAGAKVEFLPRSMRLYHIDHDSRTYSKEANWLTRTRLRQVLPRQFLVPLRGLIRQFIPAKTETGQFSTTSEIAMKLAADIVNGRRSYIYNDESWGLGEEKLEEYVVTKADVFI